VSYEAVWLVGWDMPCNAKRDGVACSLILVLTPDSTVSTSYGRCWQMQQTAPRSSGTMSPGDETKASNCDVGAKEKEQTISDTTAAALDGQDDNANRSYPVQTGQASSSKGRTKREASILRKT